jgi:hypothetical protein
VTISTFEIVQSLDLSACRSNTITTLKKQFRQMATEAAAGSRYEPSCHKALLLKI